MKRRILTLALAGLLLLTGCSSMLEQTYVREEHLTENEASGGEDYLLVEDENQLSNAIFRLVDQGESHGVLRLPDWEEADVERVLGAACLQVTEEDPLGAYAVAGIRYRSSHIISYYEVELEISYRHTREQTEELVQLTNNSALRSEMRTVLGDFSPEALFRVRYFSGDEESVRELIRAAYYETPAAALGEPAVTVKLYPAHTAGSERIVEVQLAYPEEPEILRAKQRETLDAAEKLLTELGDVRGDEAVRAAYRYLYRRCAGAVPGEEKGSAWAVLTRDACDSRGMALTMELLCQYAGVECMTVSGRKNGERCTWNIVRLAGGEYRHVDATAEDGCLCSDAGMLALGYTWDRTDGSLPLCGEQPPEDEKTAQSEN